MSSISYSIVAGIGLLVSILLAFFITRRRNHSILSQLRTEEEAKRAILEEQLRNEREKVGQLSGELHEEEERAHVLQSRVEQAEQRNVMLEGKVAELDETKTLLQRSLLAQQQAREELATVRAELEAEQRQGGEKLALLEESREKLALQFKSLANDILEDKSKRFTRQNQEQLDQLLSPLRTKLVEFQGQVERTYVREGKERSELAAQVRQLMELNTRLSDDAHNLTRALKGSSKTQGDWGELILERVLEMSGLRRGEEYVVQESHTRDDGSRLQPDVVINLPDAKHLVVDSKVSLKAYLSYAGAESDAEREVSLKRHVDSVRSHIKGLSGKNYQQLYGVDSPDFVIMFLPVEPAFMLAVSEDGELWQDAWQKNVILVSPSTLLFVVRTVAHIWRQEHQNRNALEIARRGGLLYDKFRNFAEDLDKIGQRLRQASDSYEHACTKFYRGSGNLVRQVEMLRELGVQPKCELSREKVELAMMDDVASITEE